MLYVALKAELAATKRAYLVVLDILWAKMIRERLAYSENVMRAYLRYVNAVLAGSLLRRTVQKVLQKIMRAGTKQPKAIAEWAMAKLSKDSMC